MLGAPVSNFSRLNAQQKGMVIQMKKLYSKQIVSIILALVLSCSLGIVAFATPASTNEDNAILAATSWMNEHYGDYYTLSDVDATIIRTFESSSEIRYYILVTCKTLLKADDVTDLPFVQGLNSYVSAQSNTRALSLGETAAIDEFVDGLEEYIGEYSDMSVDLVYCISKTRSSDPVALYYQDMQTTTLSDVNDISLSTTEMYNSGVVTASALLSPQISTYSYTGYDRIAARDYALTYSSNATSCYDDGSTCSVMQNRTYWNNTTYPYWTIFKHADCADFVSQCLVAGGIPVDPGAWQRGNDSGAWANAAYLKNYMVANSYWTTSTFAAAAAGAVRHTGTGEHVVLVTYNDTVTHRYSGHTWDRCNRDFINDNVNFEYYIINQ